MGKGSLALLRRIMWLEFKEVGALCTLTRFVVGRIEDLINDGWQGRETGVYIQSSWFVDGVSWFWGCEFSQIGYDGS